MQSFFSRAFHWELGIGSGSVIEIGFERGVHLLLPVLLAIVFPVLAMRTRA